MSRAGWSRPAGDVEDPGGRTGERLLAAVRGLRVRRRQTSGRHRSGTRCRRGRFRGRAAGGGAPLPRRRTAGRRPRHAGLSTGDRRADRPGAGRPGNDRRVRPSHHPARFTGAGRPDDVQPVPGARRRGRLGSPPGPGRGRFRQGAGGLAGRAALRVGVQPDHGRRPGLGDLPLRRAAAARSGHRQRGGHASGDGPPGGLVGQPGLPGPGHVHPLAASPAGSGRGRRTGLCRGRRPHPRGSPTPAGRRDRLPGPRPRPAGRSPPGGQRDRGQRLPARPAARVGPGLGGGRPADLPDQRPRHLLPQSVLRLRARTGRTCLPVAWACGWPASCGTTSTSCPPTPA